MHATPERVGIPALEQVDRNGEDSAEDEKVQQSGVAHLAGEVAARAYSAPDQAGVEVSAGEGAGEVVNSVRSADTFDVSECPGQYAGGAECSGNHADTLHEEETTRGNLGDVNNSAKIFQENRAYVAVMG